MLKFRHVVVLRNVEVGHVVVLLLRNVEDVVFRCSVFLEVGHVVVLLLRNVEGWSCSSFVVKKC